MDQKPNLLIVDDIWVNLFYLEEVLKGLDVKLIKAQSGAEALEKSRGVELAMAILDIQMPEMDGFELAEKLNSDRGEEKLPIIFLTAFYNGDIQVLKGYELGVVDFIVKPVNERILLSKISVFLEIYRQKRTILDNAKVLKQNLRDLTQLHKSIMQSEEKYRMLTDFAPDAFFQGDSEGNIITLNNEALSLTGYSREELLKMKIFDLFPEAILNEKPLRFDLLKTGLSLRTERTLIRKDGSLAYIEMNSKQMPDKTFQSFFRDLTRLRKAEEIIESGNKLPSLMNDLRGMLYSCEYTPDWTMKFVSDSSYNLTGYFPVEIIDNRLISYSDIIHPDDREMIWETISSFLNTFSYFTVEYRIVTKNNTVKWVLEYGQAEHWEDGTISSITGLITDITERKALELLQKALFRISASVGSSIDLNEFIEIVNEQLGTIIRTENLFLAVYDEASGCIRVPANTEITETAETLPVKKSLIGKVLKSQKPLFLSEDNIRKMIAAKEINLAGAIPKVWLGVPLVVEPKTLGVIVLQSLDNESEYSASDLEVLENAAPVIALCLEKLNNESEIKKSHQALLQLTRHLEDIREEERKRIALDLHDDLGQRLTALNMGIAWLSKNIPATNDAVNEKITDLKDMVHDTSSMVQKISSGLRPTILDNLGIIAAIKWQLREFSKNTEIKCYPRIAPIHFELNPRISILIFRLVQEALTNVMRHADADRVSLLFVKTKGQVHLEINDNGNGISLEQIQDIHSFGILGMKERVQSYGGTFNISGKPGKGTRVLINLPIK